MALIENAKGRKEGSGYERLFGDNQLGYLLSRIQATVISTGIELEKMIVGLSNRIEDVDTFLSEQKLSNGTFLISKSAIKKSKLKSNLEPDILIFKIDAKKQHCYIIELKDGDAFDTKKSQSEKDLLLKFQNHISSKLRFTTSVHICSFNQLDKKKIVEGLKHKITEEMAMTGKELCEILGLDYKKLLHSRIHQQKKNLTYFVDELIKVDAIRILLQEKLKDYEE